MSHYEERLEADLAAIRQRIEAVGEQVETAHKAAVHALLTGDRALAYETILADNPVNREVRAIDRDCHAFVARHQPSAGHLRFVSAVLRLGVGLERVGDYASTICREALQLSESPSQALARDIDLMADQSRAVLRQAMRAWNEGNADLARGTVGMAQQAAVTSRKVFEDLLNEGEERRGPLNDLFALLVIFNRMDRVIAQAKNICEETLFAVSGETKAPKVYRILFLDERNDGASLLAEAHARKAFSEAAVCHSAGWAPAESIEPRALVFMDQRGLDTSALAPSPPVLEDLADYHVIVSFGGDVRPHLPELPFHTVVLEWELGPGPEGMDQERGEKLLEAMHQEIASRLQALMETLRGEEVA
ncbi:MAG: PhoU domain-containing protein [Acidobacteriota bacterium]